MKHKLRRSRGETTRNGEVKIWKFVKLKCAWSSEIRIKTYRCPINEIFSALFIRRDARFGRKGREPETSPRSRVISLGSNYWQFVASRFDLQMNWVTSTCRESVLPQSKVHSLNISIDIWHQQHLPIEKLIQTILWWKSRKSRLRFHFTFFFFSLRRLLHFITTSFQMQ